MSGPILVTGVGAATGSRDAAAALACAGSDADRAGLLIDLTDGRSPRPALVATAAARMLEERLAAHLPEAPVASRGRICQLTLSADESGIERIAAALPLARGSVGVVHLPPHLLQDALTQPRIELTAALLRADLRADRALTALAVSDLMERGVRVAVLKAPLGWLTTRAALVGALPESSPALPPRVIERLLGAADNTIQNCYDWKGDAERDRKEASRQESQGSGARESAPRGGREGFGH